MYNYEEKLQLQLEEVGHLFYGSKNRNVFDDDLHRSSTSKR